MHAVWGSVLLAVWFLGVTPQAGTDVNGRNALMKMVEEQIVSRGVSDPKVLAALRVVPRHAFVPPTRRSQAYEDGPLPIGHGQTISQPYIVALMTEVLDLKPTDRVLEIGTGSGYQAAVLSELAGEVFSIEIVDELAQRARKTLRSQGYDNVQVRSGDGWGGWPEAAPFDAIIVTCAPDEVPSALRDQLREGGRLVIPVGPAKAVQELLLFKKGAEGLEKQALIPVRFVPMTGGGAKTEDP